MANSFKSFLKVLAAEQKAAEKTEQENAAALKSFRDAGWIRPGPKNEHTGETPVLVTWEDSPEVEEYVEPSVFLATVLAEDIEDIDDGNAMIRRYETRVDESGKEFFITEKKTACKDLVLSCKKSFYTDSKGMILSPAEVLARLGVYVESVSVCEGPVSEEFPPASIPPVSVNPFTRTWAFDSAPTISQERFERLQTQPKKVVNLHELFEASAAADAIKAAEKQASADAVVHARPECTEADLPVAKKAPESPTKVMTWKDRVAFAKRRKAAEKKVCPELTAKISGYEKELTRMKKRLSALSREIKDIRQAPTGLVFGPKRTKFREEVLPGKLEQASDIRMEIVWINETIVSLKEGI